MLDEVAGIRHPVALDIRTVGVIGVRPPIVTFGEEIVQSARAARRMGGGDGDRVPPAGTALAAARTRARSAARSIGGPGEATRAPLPPAGRLRSSRPRAPRGPPLERRTTSRGGMTTRLIRPEARDRSARASAPLRASRVVARPARPSSAARGADHRARCRPRRRRRCRPARGRPASQIAFIAPIAEGSFAAKTASTRGLTASSLFIAR